MATPTIEELALQVAALSYTVSKFLKDSNQEQPSYSANGPFAFPTSAPSDICAAREKLLEVTQTLHDIVLGPEESLRTKATEWANSSALRWIQHFKIPSHVPLEGSVSYKDLATAAAVPESQLKRIVRFTILNGFFFESTPGQVSHSAQSKLLATSPQLQDYVGHCIEFSQVVSVKMAEMTEKYNGGDAMDQTAFNVAFDTPLPMFAWLKGEPEHAARFGRLMAGMKSAPVYSVDHLVDGYDWAALGRGKIVDVGGSGGHTSFAVAKKFPELDFVVQDLEYVVHQNADAVPEDLKSKIEFMPHDFFTPQPVKDADIYLLRQILHDWPDDKAITILKHLVGGLKDGAKILVMDQVVPAPGSTSNSQERAARNVDLVVMSHFNGKQRDLDDWNAIFKAVDERLVIRDITLNPGSVLSVIELGLDEAGKSSGDAEAILEEPVKVAENVKTAGPEQIKVSFQPVTIAEEDSSPVELPASEKSWTAVSAPADKAECGEKVQSAVRIEEMQSPENI